MSNVVRGSPSLVGRGIANPMFARTRGFKSHSPRFFFPKFTIFYHSKKYEVMILNKNIIEKQKKKFLKNRFSCLDYRIFDKRNGLRNLDQLV